MSRRRTSRHRLGGPLGISALVHFGALAAVAVIARPEAPLALPPVYKVQLFAAPPGPRQMGVVQSRPAAEEAPPAQASEPAVPPPAPDMAERAMPSPTRTPDVPKRPQQQATPNPVVKPAPAKDAGKAGEKAGEETTTKAPPSKAPVAGGGPEGGRGADVANVNTPGIDFPYPSYLQNIVRQITLRFAPPRGSSLSAQVRFTIRRDGTVTGISVTKGSGNYEFDTEARGAVEAVGRNGDFGPLPAGFRDDALTVYFAFDPKIIR